MFGVTLEQTRNGNRKEEKQKVVPFKKRWLPLVILLRSPVSYGWFQQRHRPKSIHFEMESVDPSVKSRGKAVFIHKLEWKKHQARNETLTKMQKWLVCLTKQRLAALRKRNKRHQFRRLSVSCRVQCGILLHRLFCCLPFDYFVCTTTLKDLGETKKLKSIKQHHVCLLNGFHRDLPIRTDLILVSNFRSCSSELSLISSSITWSED